MCPSFVHKYLIVFLRGCPTDLPLSYRSLLSLDVERRADFRASQMGLEMDSRAETPAEENETGRTLSASPVPSIDKEKPESVSAHSCWETMIQLLSISAIGVEFYVSIFTSRFLPRYCVVDTSLGYASDRGIAEER